MTARHLWVLTGLVALLLAGSVLYAAARLAWHREGHTAVVPLALSAPPPPPPALDDAGRASIAALAPFGQAAAPAAAETAQAPARLDVVLRGVLVDPDPALSRAFLLSEGRTGVYRVGETVQGAEVVSVDADSVTLRTDAGLVVVGFGGLEGETGGDALAKAGDAAENPSDPMARLAAAIRPGQGSIELRETPPPQTTEDYITLWRERITLDPKAAMEAVGIEPVENGYRVKENPNIGVTMAGLRPGDVVTRLNGQTVGNLETDRDLYDQVAASGIARLEVQREGQALLLTFPLR